MGDETEHAIYRKQRSQTEGLGLFDAPPPPTTPPDPDDEARGTQRAAILAALRNGDRITPLDALRRFNSFRLAAQVCALLKAGWPIITEDITTDTGKRIAEYSLAPEDRG